LSFGESLNDISMKAYPVGTTVEVRTDDFIF
jgi:hypothetical protein